LINGAISRRNYRIVVIKTSEQFLLVWFMKCLVYQYLIGSISLNFFYLKTLNYNLI
jgi:hypothetical protein